MFKDRNLELFEEFEEFKKIRYNAPPWDSQDNPVGFPAYRSGASDISAHLYALQYFASQCSHVTEFGTRDCFSTVALIAGAKKKVISYDIQSTESTDILQEMNRSEVLPSEWEFRLQSTVDSNHQIEPTEFLFIDSLHTFNQLEKELLLHSNNVSRFIGFHDTITHGKESQDVPGAEGINRAIEEFLVNNVTWSVCYQVDFNHGLVIIENKEAILCG